MTIMQCQTDLIHVISIFLITMKVWVMDIVAEKNPCQWDRCQKKRHADLHGMEWVAPNLFTFKRTNEVRGRG